MRKKIPLLAAALCFIWPGVGQVYNDDGAKGILFAVVYAGLMVTYVKVIPDFGQIFLIIAMFYSIVHAYKMADYTNQAGKTQSQS
ncbi:hypothetical protein [Aureibacillus halotolerans]|uniref:TM2 domain-containing protein n=1 Tax=Aureibacillus halotolerans TaxID=1508390 RepID=A0A4R6U4D9_9BACI|nr:hypothetical protein [Aureibacillus halotolerans]TDQ40352.1 hypothetical protein EV213_10668 [Aureibacillus halotolerans]